MVLADDAADWAGIGLSRARVSEVADREAARFEDHTPRSAELLRRGRRRMPRGVPMGWMADLYPSSPIFAVRGEGPRFWDVDDNVYLDFNLCDLSMPCGFAPPILVEAISEQARRGVQFLLPTEDAEVVAHELERRFGMPFWQVTLSASLANTEALRLARLATGRDRIVVFGGRYHGHIHDTLHATADGERERTFLGLPANAGAGTTRVEYNDLDALGRELASGDVAAVLIEPVLTNCTVVLPDDGFHDGIRRLCDEHGAVLVVDETHTQFAVWGGGTRRFNLRPDIVTGGKGIAGGIAIGVYGMTPELAELMERHPDSDFVDDPGIATGGTLFANALSLAAARATLVELLTEKAHAEVDRLGGRLADGIDASVAAHGLPWLAHRFGGRTGYCLHPRLPRTEAEAEASIVPLLAAARKAFFANRGVWDAIATSGPSISTAHSEQDVDTYLEVLDAFLTEIL